jgi:hypothetical protein
MYRQLCNACIAGDVDSLKKLCNEYYSENVPDEEYEGLIMAHLLKYASNVNVAKYLISKYSIKPARIKQALYVVDNYEVYQYLKSLLKNIGNNVRIAILDNTFNADIACDAYDIRHDDYEIHVNTPEIYKALTKKDAPIDVIYSLKAKELYHNDIKTLYGNKANRIHSPKFYMCKSLASAKREYKNGATDYEKGVLTTNSIAAAKFLVKKGNITRLTELNVQRYEINEWLYKKNILYIDFNEYITTVHSFPEIRFCVEHGAKNIDEILCTLVAQVDGYLRGGENYSSRVAEDPEYDSIEDIEQHLPTIKYLIDNGGICVNLRLELYFRLIGMGCGIILNHVPKLRDFEIAEEYVLFRKKQRKRILTIMPIFVHRLIDVVMDYLPYVKFFNKK